MKVSDAGDTLMLLSPAVRLTATVTVPVGSPFNHTLYDAVPPSGTDTRAVESMITMSSSAAESKSISY